MAENSHFPSAGSLLSPPQLLSQSDSNTAGLLYAHTQLPEAPEHPTPRNGPFFLGITQHAQAPGIPASSTRLTPPHLPAQGASCSSSLLSLDAVHHVAPRGNLVSFVAVSDKEFCLSRASVLSYHPRTYNHAEYHIITKQAERHAQQNSHFAKLFDGFLRSKTHPLTASSPVPRHLPKTNKNIFLHKCLSMSAHSSIIHTSQELKTIQMCIKSKGRQCGLSIRGNTAQLQNGSD